MKRQLQLMVIVIMSVCSMQATAQDGNVKTIFKGNLRSSGGYAAISNKFTTIRGDYTNLAGLYGGWYINPRMRIGLGAAASTNNLRVPQQFSTDPNQNRTWQYA